jgi:hypothetical protein
MGSHNDSSSRMLIVTKYVNVRFEVFTAVTMRSLVKMNVQESDVCKKKKNK